MNMTVQLSIFGLVTVTPPSSRDPNLLKWADRPTLQRVLSYVLHSIQDRQKCRASRTWRNLAIPELCPLILYFESATYQSVSIQNAIERTRGGVQSCHITYLIPFKYTKLSICTYGIAKSLSRKSFCKVIFLRLSEKMCNQAAM